MVPNQNRDAYLSERLMCPCKKCKGTKIRKRSITIEHIEDNGLFDASVVDTQVEALARHEGVDFSMVQTTWKGSSSQKCPQEAIRSKDMEEMQIHDTDMEEMIDAFFMVDAATSTMHNNGIEDPKESDPIQERLRNLSSTPIFEGSRASILRTCLSILHLQSMYGWSDTSVTSLFKLLKESLVPFENSVPESRTAAKKVLASVGMDYTSIHACPNDCVLFKKEHAFLTKCPKCGVDRYRQDLQGSTTPAKVLRHFPIVPRIQHIYRCKDLVKLMSWHSLHGSEDGIMRVPADSKAWKHIDKTWPTFAAEPRNLRLGLAMDGVNPFGVRSTSWSTWPIVLVNYNIPPWLTIRKGHLLLSLLVPGKYKVKNMDVYMEPLVDELEVLWEGIKVYDMSSPTHRRSTTIRGILMWTMHDFPGYGEASGLATSGYYACPICGPNLCARHSKHLKKMVYDGHKRFLPEGHIMREGFLGRPPKDRWSSSMQ